MPQKLPSIMATAAQPPNAPPPPGSTGLPGLGETLAFTKDPFAFVQERRARFGRVFRTSLLGRKTAVLVGPEPIEAFYDPANVVRDGANPPHVQTLFGGAGVINNLDGEEHALRQSSVSAALSREAIETYLPTMTRFVDAAFARWIGAGEIGWNDEFKRLAIETLGAVFASIEPGPDLAALVTRCERIAAAFTALPIPLPGTAFTKGVRAKNQALAYYRGLVRAHRERSYDDGLARLLAARAADGTTIGDEDAPGELNHLFLAGFVVFAQFAATVVYLTQHPEVRERVAAAAATLSDAPTAADLAASAYLMQVVNEVRRLTPIVPIVFGKARRPFAVDGFVVPAGWGVAAAVWANDREAATFAEPERFDPDRFGARAEQNAHAYAYTPQGAGPPDGHRCPGFDLTAIFMALFTARLVRGYSWTLPVQDLAPNWSVVPPVPRDGLRAVVRPLRIP
jgi:cytochrome P450